MQRLELLSGFLAGVAEKAVAMPDFFKVRIAERLTVLVDTAQYALDPARMAQEVAHLVDKADISEEIVRLRAHIDQFYAEINDLVADRKGKKLLREINTIGSKANLLEITRLVVDMKNELEKVREQVLNIV